MDSVLDFVKFLVIITVFLFLIKPLFYLFGLFVGFVSNIFNVFSYLGASCSAIVTISGLFTTLILGFLIMKMYGIFHHST